MRIGVFGVGAIGSALVEFLRINPSNELYLFDPSKGYRDDLSKVEVYFICVPVKTTPQGLQDYTNIERCLDMTDKSKPIFCRSTVLPGTCDLYGMMALPEFLTEDTAKTDIKRLPWVFGSTQGSRDYIAGLIKAITIGLPDPIGLTNTQAEFVKYLHNCFLATKNSFMNMAYDYYKFMVPDSNYTDFEAVTSALTVSGLIADSHLKIVHKGKRGFNGKCLPKDLKAFVKQMIKVGYKKYGFFHFIHSYNKDLLNSQGIDGIYE